MVQQNQTTMALGQVVVGLGLAVTTLSWDSTKATKVKLPNSFTKKEINMWQMGENPFRCTTHDEKGLVLTIDLFYPIVWSP
jgi:hypothetical protein